MTPKTRMATEFGAMKRFAIKMSTLAIAAPLITPIASAYDQTFESCGLSAWEIFNAVESYTLDVPLENLTKNHINPHNVIKVYETAKDKGIKTGNKQNQQNHEPMSTTLFRPFPKQSKASQYHDQCIGHGNQ